MFLDYRILCFLIVLKWAHTQQVPTMPYRQALYFHKLQKYPSYKIINAQEARLATTEPAVISTELVEAATTTSTLAPPTSADTANDSSTDASPTDVTTKPATAPLEISTGNTIYTPDEFPHDLLEIARSKLGLKSLDEVPSISELAEFLGTANASETIKYIRQMTNTEQGIALIKAYLESADFTDRTDEQRRRQQQQQALNVAATTETKKNNFLERVAAYFHIYNLWPQSGSADAAETRKNVEQQLSKYIKPQLAYRKRMQATHQTPNSVAHHKPMLVRNPLPYHYPVPLRPISDNRVRHNDAVAMPIAPPVVFSPVHLNTPKFYVPPHIELARATNIPPQQLQTLLQSKPKLAELAAKVSRLPLTNDHSTRIDEQLLVAVKRAIEQDDDLRKLLQSTAATLK
ncbi:uncharacterized protein LOC120771565 [Bactrocera tryoni]|uniref:uncharacterized protein LOC120771565 n=1 Tax=Bactrocera tryoni TaxID=59916 RepID=UPI001A95C8E3|nr:uncharacterized protein LOC120771565 [Bactrocera tryoni]XP_039955564.1 uncharacterized protein LOC120771565 [Bactrocera tryoni]XP_039955565.1 uncharacterized protein LOC120771565 [Bactrocera tryoni]